MTARLYPSRTACHLKQTVTVERDHCLRACRVMLRGSDTPGRRWLIRQLHGDGAPYGAESIGASLPLLGLERLQGESPHVVGGGDIVCHEPAKAAS